MSVSINLILRDIYKQIIYHVTWQGIGVLPKQTFVCTIDGYILSKLESIDLEVCVGCVKIYLRFPIDMQTNVPVANMPTPANT